MYIFSLIHNYTYKQIPPLLYVSVTYGILFTLFSLSFPLSSLF